MVAAWTDSSSWVESRAVSRVRNPLSSAELMVTLTESTAMETSSRRLWLSTTWENSRWVIFGVSSPTSVAAVMAASSKAPAALGQFSTLNRSRSRMPSFFWGSGL